MAYSNCAWPHVGKRTTAKRLLGLLKECLSKPIYLGDRTIEWQLDLQYSDDMGLCGWSKFRTGSGRLLRECEICENHRKTLPTRVDRVSLWLCDTCRTVVEPKKSKIKPWQGTIASASALAIIIMVFFYFIE